MNRAPHRQPRAGIGRAGLRAVAAPCRRHPQGRDRPDQQLGEPGADARPGRRHLQEERPGARDLRHRRGRRNAAADHLRQRRHRHRSRRRRRHARIRDGRADPHPRAGLHRLVRSFLVRACGFADQEAVRRHPRQHRRLFHQWIELAQSRARLRRRTRPQGEADADRKSARDPDGRHVRPDRHRLGGAADRHAGDQGR